MILANSKKQEQAESECDHTKDRPIPPAHIRGRTSSRCHLDAEAGYAELRSALEDLSLVADSCCDTRVRGSQ
jgi:hypothetical protein